MFTTDRLPGRVAHLNDENWLYFSGTSYLNMAKNAAFQHALMESVRRYGTNFGGSRLSNMRLEVFGRAERFLAEWTGAAAALTVSSGTLAGQLVVQALADRGDFYFAPDVHPALFGEGDYAHETFEAWSLRMLDIAQNGEPMVFFAGALDPLRARKYDFSWLQELPNDVPITLVLDDSHGIGITGRDGAGIFSTLKAPANAELIVIASLGKALALPGGVILGRQDFIQKILHASQFGGASPMVPAYLDAFLQTQSLYRQARQILFRNVVQFAEAFAELSPFQNFTNYPVFYTEKKQLAAWLGARKVVISSFRYPTPKDQPITRVVISTAHDEDDIAFLIQLVRLFFERFPSF